MSKSWFVTKRRTVGDRLIGSGGVWKSGQLVILVCGKALYHGGQCHCRAKIVGKHCKVRLANMFEFEAPRTMPAHFNAKLTSLVLVVSRRELPLAAKVESAISTVCSVKNVERSGALAERTVVQL